MLDSCAYREMIIGFLVMVAYLSSTADKFRYKNLFNAIGYAHGRRGQDEFRLPDYRGYFLRGVTDDVKVAPECTSRGFANGTTGNQGADVGSSQESSVGPHAHPVRIFNGYENPNPARQNPSHDWHCFCAHAYSNVNEPREADPANSPGRTVGIYDGKESRPINKYVHFIIRAE